MNYAELRAADEPIYSYEVLGRLRYYRGLFVERARHRYVMTLSLAPLLFRPAELTFEKELQRLQRRIVKQAARRRNDVAKLQKELKEDAVNALQAYHPANQYASGKLTKRGAEVCYRLYDLGKSPLVVAHLMSISLSAATNRRKLWRAAGGSRRQRIELEHQ